MIVITNDTSEYLTDLRTWSPNISNAKVFMNAKEGRDFWVSSRELCKLGNEHIYLRRITLVLLENLE